MNELTHLIRERYLSALDKIAVAAKKSGRGAEAVKLVVVTKLHSVETVRAAIEAGVSILGENYAEEGVTKIQLLENCSSVEWHMIGHVQSRKAPLVANYFDWMHSLDSLKLAKRLDRFCAEAKKTLPVLLEFNVGGEESKGGWEAADETRWENLLADVSEIAALPNLSVRGLMCMPPLGADAEFARPYFQRLRNLRDYLTKQLPQTDFSELSMGTSADYEAAAEEGSTFVRIGTAIVGQRHYATETK
ncbi:MAG: YggS family pyridoxal phosphate-dependent enzyme [Anaerolineales bacterium]|nr:YggS family pyridoxal phosphate-dependent enzyme [Anaerolineales bacterium]